MGEQTAKPHESHRAANAESVATLHASGVWDYEWRQACGKHRNPSDLIFIMHTVDSSGRTTTKIPQWAATKGRIYTPDPITFPGHMFEEDSPAFPVLLVAPFARNVARMLVQHKEVCGHNRDIEVIRF